VQGNNRAVEQGAWVVHVQLGSPVVSPQSRQDKFDNLGILEESSVGAVEALDLLEESGVADPNSPKS